jgi:GT2 family glycosyltransferase
MSKIAPEMLKSEESRLNRGMSAKGDETSLPMAAGTTTPLVVIVVLNWKACDVTLRCVDSLATIDYPRYRIVVIDNESTEESARLLAAEPSIELIRNRDNLGFTGGVNVGIRWAIEHGADYVWLFNNDATSPPDTLSKLVAAAEANERIGLVSAVLYDPAAPERPSPFLACGGEATDDLEQAREWQEKRPNEIVLYGTALLIRRTVIAKIGMFDERFFAYYEDYDYSLRSSRAGFRNICVPGAIVYHPAKHPVEDTDSVQPHVYYYSNRNSILLRKKESWRLLFRKDALWFFRSRLAHIERSRHNRISVDAQLAGLWDGLRGVYGAYDPNRRMPQPWRALLARYPGFWIAVLDRRLPWRTQAPRP